jgi:hypothetical protein
MSFNFSKLILGLLIFSTFLIAQNYEIKHDSLNASGWFGGDDRPGQQRNVAITQSILVEEPVTLETFSFYFTSPFDSVNGTLSGHEVTLKLHIRDSTGTILQAETIVVPNNFTSGWVTWSNINYNITVAGKYIFSTYLVGGYDSIQVHSGQSCDLNAGYINGERYVKYVTNDTDAEVWGDWSQHPWDSNFWLTGTSIPTNVEDINLTAHHFKLEQNYPNPFNPTTKISWQASISSWQTLKVYDMLGREIATLIDEYKPAGNYDVEFDANDFPSGIYFYQLKTENFVETKKLILMK